MMVTVVGFTGVSGEVDGDGDDCGGGGFGALGGDVTRLTPRPPPRPPPLAALR